MIASLVFLNQNFEFNFQSKHIWKRYCKKALDNYNAIPSLNIDCQNKQDQRTCFLIRLKVTKLSSIFSQLPGAFGTNISQVGGARLVRQSRKGNLGDRPVVGIFAKQ